MDQHNINRLKNFCMNFVGIDFDYLIDWLVHNIDCLNAIDHIMDNCLL